MTGSSETGTHGALRAAVAPQTLCIRLTCWALPTPNSPPAALSNLLSSASAGIAGVRASIAAAASAKYLVCAAGASSLVA